MEREIIDKAKGINLMSYIEQVLGLVPQRRASGGTFYFSPFRQEKEASLHVSLSNGIWQWFDHGSANRDGGDMEFPRSNGHTERLGKIENLNLEVSNERRKWTEEV